MERRELYDPEDIEQLLIERAYDDLLEEERSFVLRHLTGRAEYEAMRALLLRVHEDERPAGSLDADPEVRTHVIDVFRAQQRPQWRIWLNTVQAFLLPREASAMWRPALALGSLALLVTFSVINLRTQDKAGTNALAEVKQQPASTGKATAVPTEQQPAAPPEATSAGPASSLEDHPQPTRNMDLPVDDVSAATAKSATEENAGPASVLQGVADERTNNKENTSIVSASAAAPATVASGTFEAQVADTTRTKGDLASHQVTRAELVANATVAGTTAASNAWKSNADRFALNEKEKKEAESDARKGFLKDTDATAYANDASAFVDLLRAAW